MQLDLGAINTVFYGNSINPYLEKYQELKSKIDTTLTFRIQSQTNFKLKGVELKLGNVNLGKSNIGIFKNFGTKIPKDSVNTKAYRNNCARFISKQNFNHWLRKKKNLYNRKTS